MCVYCCSHVSSTLGRAICIYVGRCPLAIYKQNWDMQEVQSVCNEVGHKGHWGLWTSMHYPGIKSASRMCDQNILFDCYMHMFALVAWCLRSYERHPRQQAELCSPKYCFVCSCHSIRILQSLLPELCWRVSDVTGQLQSYDSYRV